jgi:hypothetical protein
VIAQKLFHLQREKEREREQGERAKNKKQKLLRTRRNV